MEFNISTDIFEDLTYLLYNKTFDVKIKVGKENDIKEFSAHSTILSTRSIHFQNALSNQTKESGCFILEKPNISPSIFNILLKYIYSGKLTVKKNVKCLYVIIAAYDLQLQNVVEHLENYFKENDSAWKLPKDFFIISEQRQLKQLEEQVLKLACTDPIIIFNCKDFPQLNEGFLIRLLKRNDLELNEINIFYYLVKWGIVNTGLTLNKKSFSPILIFDKDRSILDFVIDTRKWTPIDFMNLEKTIRNCIPHIRFYQMSLGDYTEVKNEFKDILPNGLDDEIMQHFKDSNPLMRIPSNDNILPPRESACPFDSNIINAKDVALIATWINGGKGKKHVFQFKNIHFKFECVYRSSIDGFDKYDNLYKYKRVVIVIKVRNSGEIIGVYNPFGWDISYSEYILFKLFRDFLSRYFIFSLTNRVNPIISYHKEGAMSKISNERHILFGTSDLSINGIYCTSEQHSFKKKIIDKVRFEIDELEVFHITNKNIVITLSSNIPFLIIIFILYWLWILIIFIILNKK
ncbi:hypothetical protein RhiirA5_409275 [Rhizophagus irregularis]|uniref:BTB domain-containing protein n=1 Tax=Rhizophagus irregularis TaxID=588596 RepID=A0A2N0Q636_9GLOM|nr:hypothetical protein RhiirA5_409275 [Rhizophagus irregularis]GBC19885.2 BTB/POZ domain-containing protein [Rhizophagus irregularis DAOM 181602=DAOM 197198]